MQWVRPQRLPLVQHALPIHAAGTVQSRPAAGVDSQCASQVALVAISRAPGTSQIHRKDLVRIRSCSPWPSVGSPCLMVCSPCPVDCR